jgi:hypothetical protein
MTTHVIKSACHLEGYRHSVIGSENVIMENNMRWEFSTDKICSDKIGKL